MRNVKKRGRDPNKPKRPGSAFFIFMSDFRKTYQEKHPNNKSVAAASVAGSEKWRSMSSVEKVPYVLKANDRMKEYGKTMVAYNKQMTDREENLANMIKPKDCVIRSSTRRVNEVNELDSESDSSPSSSSSSSESDSQHLEPSQPTADFRSLPRNTSTIVLDREHSGDEGDRQADEDDGNDIPEEAAKGGSSSDVLIVNKRKAYHSEGSGNIVPKKKGKKDDSWRLHGPCPGGPVDPSVIPSFGGHILFAICSDSSKDRGVINAYNRASGENHLSRTWQLEGQVKKNVEASGLNHLSRCMIKNLDMPLLSAFIERWQPDTNTFHLPFGEITILLHDVQQILGISIDGDMCGVPGNYDDHVTRLCALLGKREEEISKPYQAGVPTLIYEDGAVMTKPLLDVGCTGSIEDQVRAYLALLLGQTLFVDKSKDRIRLHLFPLLNEVDRVCDYAWGAGALAYLYRQLGVATRTDCHGIAGCLTLLQVWIYEYFPEFRRHASTKLTPGEPRAFAWMNGPEFPLEKEALSAYRVRLDRLTSSSVLWQPYRHLKIPMTSFYMGILRFMEITEPYQADRCLRQFGYVQIVPSSMLQPAECSRPASETFYSVDHGMLDQLWKGRMHHKVVTSNLFMLLSDATCEDGYMEWFLSVSRPFFVHPDEQVKAPLDVDLDYKAGMALARIVLQAYSCESAEEIGTHFLNNRGNTLTLVTQLLTRGGGGGASGLGEGAQGRGAREGSG